MFTVLYAAPQKPRESGGNVCGVVFKYVMGFGGTGTGLSFLRLP